jgi:hypothetical protein
LIPCLTGSKRGDGPDDDWEITFRFGALVEGFIEGGMEGVPPAKWQQSGLSSGIEEEVKA